MTPVVPQGRPKVIAVVGNRKSGKTKVVEFLISNLSKRGFKVGSVKHIHDPDFTIDTRGKDTWRHMQAGAKVTVSVAKGELAVIRKMDTARYGLDDIVNLFRDENLDLIILEGFKYLVGNNGSILKIVTVKSLSDLKTLLPHLKPPMVVAYPNVAEAKEAFKELEVIDPTWEGSRLLQLVERELST